MQGVTEAASAVQPVAQTAAAPASAAQSLAPQMLSQLGQLPQPPFKITGLALGTQSLDLGLQIAYSRS